MAEGNDEKNPEVQKAVQAGSDLSHGSGNAYDALMREVSSAQQQYGTDQAGFNRFGDAVAKGLRQSGTLEEMSEQFARHNMDKLATSDGHNIKQTDLNPQFGTNALQKAFLESLSENYGQLQKWAGTYVSGHKGDEFSSAELQQVIDSRQHARDVAEHGRLAQDQGTREQTKFGTITTALFKNDGNPHHSLFNLLDGIKTGGDDHTDGDISRGDLKRYQEEYAERAARGDVGFNPENLETVRTLEREWDQPLGIALRGTHLRGGKGSNNEQQPNSMISLDAAGHAMGVPADQLYARYSSPATTMTNVDAANAPVPGEQPLPPVADTGPVPIPRGTDGQPLAPADPIVTNGAVDASGNPIPAAGNGGDPNPAQAATDGTVVQAPIPRALGADGQPLPASGGSPVTDNAGPPETDDGGQPVTDNAEPVHGGPSSGPANLAHWHRHHRRHHGGHHLPADDTQVPAANTVVPGGDTQVPAANPAVPGGDTQVPAANPAVPGGDTQVPAANPAVPGGDTQVKPASPVAPGVDAQVTPASHAAPGVDAPVAPATSTDNTAQPKTAAAGSDIDTVQALNLPEIKPGDDQAKITADFTKAAQEHFAACAVYTVKPDDGWDRVARHSMHASGEDISSEAKVEEMSDQVAKLNGWSGRLDDSKMLHPGDQVRVRDDAWIKTQTDAALAALQQKVTDVATAAAATVPPPADLFGGNRSGEGDVTDPNAKPKVADAPSATNTTPPGTDVPATPAANTTPPATDAPATPATNTTPPGTDVPATPAANTTPPGTDVPATPAANTTPPGTDAPATPAANTTPPAAAPAHPVDKASMGKAAQDIEDAIHWYGNDNDKIIQTLEGKTPAELREMDEQFKAKHPRETLELYLGVQMSGHPEKFKRVQELMAGEAKLAEASPVANPTPPADMPAPTSAAPAPPADAPKDASAPKESLPGGVAPADPPKQAAADAPPATPPTVPVTDASTTATAPPGTAANPDASAPSQADKDAAEAKKKDPLATTDTVPNIYGNPLAGTG